MENPELAAQVIDYLGEGVAARNSYRVRLDEDGQLVWETEADDQIRRYHQDSQSTFWQRAAVGFIQILPIEHQL